MLRVPNLSFPLEYTEQDFYPALQRALKLRREEILSVRLFRRSVDARDRDDVHFVITLDAALRHENETLRRLKPGTASPVRPLPAPQLPKPDFAERPVVVGAGPAGLFAALTLARAGARPLLLERGKPIEQRAADVDRLQQSGLLDPESNVLFGEGGAGTFSDGKLTTGIKSPWQRQVLECFVRHGAPEEILWQQKPHIGTDLLRRVVRSMRQEIMDLGGELRFRTRLSALVLRGGRICAVQAGESEFPADCVLLCLGHSARDTVQALFRQGVRMTQKPFAMGVRVEHLQASIDRAQYGRFAGHPALGPASYKLNVHTPDGRGVYSFCMCPGGQVICAASQADGLAVNGMSLHARDGVNANAALLVGVQPTDFGDDHPLSGMALQRSLEHAAYRLGGGSFTAPAQRVEDFLLRRPSTAFGAVTPSYRPGVVPANLWDCLPAFIAEDLRYALPRLDGQLRGFACPDAVLTGVETRSSSPVRILRDDSGQAEGIGGLYPVGEGAGYAGGIMSAACDGIRQAVAALERGRGL